MLAFTLSQSGSTLPMLERKKADRAAKFRIGFLPTICHLTCPVTDFINHSTTWNSLFEPLRRKSWPGLKEATALREQIIPLQIVYLDQRDGTAVCVQKDSNIHSMQDLRGKRIAVPNPHLTTWAYLAGRPDNEAPPTCQTHENTLRVIKIT